METSIYGLISEELRKSTSPLTAAEIGRRLGISGGVARSRLKAMESGGLVTNSGGWQLRPGK